MDEVTLVRLRREDDVRLQETKRPTTGRQEIVIILACARLRTSSYGCADAGPW